MTTKRKAINSRKPVRVKKYPGESDPSALIRAASKAVLAYGLDRDAILSSDAHVAVLDGALTSAEEHLRKLLPTFAPYAVAVAFEGHVCRHLNTELSNIADHGHANDDPADVPPNPSDVLHRAAGFIEDVVEGRDWEGSTGREILIDLQRPFTHAEMVEHNKQANAGLAATLVPSRGPASTDRNHMLDADGEKCLYCEQSSSFAHPDDPCPARTQTNQMPEFVDSIARMKTLEEFGDYPPEQDDWIETLNDLIENARKLLPGVGPDLEDNDSEKI